MLIAGVTSTLSDSSQGILATTASAHELSSASFWSAYFGLITGLTAALYNRLIREAKA